MSLARARILKDLAAGSYNPAELSYAFYNDDITAAEVKFVLIGVIRKTQTDKLLASAFPLQVPIVEDLSQGELKGVGSDLQEAVAAFEVARGRTAPGSGSAGTNKLALRSKAALGKLRPNPRARVREYIILTYVRDQGRGVGLSQIVEHLRTHGFGDRDNTITAAAGRLTSVKRLARQIGDTGQPEKGIYIEGPRLHTRVAALLKDYRLEIDGVLSDSHAASH